MHQKLLHEKVLTQSTKNLEKNICLSGEIFGQSEHDLIATI